MDITQLSRISPFQQLVFVTRLLTSQQDNHLLAIGIDDMFFHAGHEEEWVDKSGNHATKFLHNLHKNVSITKDISMDMRVILVRVWSDGFEAHQIKAKNEFNSCKYFH